MRSISIADQRWPCYYYSCVFSQNFTVAPENLTESYTICSIDERLRISSACSPYSATAGIGATAVLVQWACCRGEPQQWEWSHLPAVD